MDSFPTIYLKKVILELSCPVCEAWIRALGAANVAVELYEYDREAAREEPQPGSREGKQEDDKGAQELEPGNKEDEQKDEATRGLEPGSRADNQASGAGELPSAPATLWITDDPAAAQRHLQKKDALLVLYHEKNRGASFPGARFACERLEELDAVYLDRVYRRCAGIPWDILETPRCLLRETTTLDVDAFYRIYAEPSVTAYMEDLFPDREQEIAYTQDYIKNIYEFYGFGVWTVCLKETGEVIGRAGLSYREGYEDPELGFLIGVPWQRRGLAEEVCRAILAFGRDELELPGVIAFVQKDNHISKKLLQKLGFTRREEGGEGFLPLHEGQPMLQYSVALSKIV